MRSRLEALPLLPALLLAATTGFALAMGAPPDAQRWGSLVGFVPILLVARRVDFSMGQTFWVGVAAGMGVGLGGFPWIAEMLVRFVRGPGAVGYFGLTIFSLWMAIPYGLWALILRRLAHGSWAARGHAVASFVALQYCWPNLFPYTPLLGFAEGPEWMQLAEVGGVALVEATVLLSSVLLADAIWAEETRARLLPGALGVLVLVSMYGFGHWRMRAVDADAEGARTLRVGLVQPNTPVAYGNATRKLKRLREPSAEAEAQGAELVVWPEAGTFPYRVARPIRARDPRLARTVLATHAVPTIFGAGTRVPGDPFGYNTSLFMSAEGEVLAHYDKINLVPLGEYIPIVDPHLLNRLVPQIAHHHRGQHIERYAMQRPGDPGGEIGFGPMICYEDIIPHFVRAVAAQEGGIDLFVNQTIDAWYGYSAEPWEHLALAQFRSVEHRIPLVRSVSTGVTAVVDHAGRLVAHIPSRPVEVDNLDDHPAEVLVHTIVLPRNTADRPTFYAQIGYVFPYLCIVATIALVLREWRSAREGRAALAS